MANPMRSAVLLMLVISPLLRAEMMPAEEFSPADIPGARLVYLDFWASWCVPCRHSFPWLNEMQEKYREDGLVVIGINLDREADKAEKFLDKYPARFSLVSDPDGLLGERYRLQGMPSSVILDSSGNELHRHIGFRADKGDVYEQVLLDLLKGE